MQSRSIIFATTLDTPQVIDCRTLDPGARTIVIVGAFVAADNVVLEATPEVLGTRNHPVNSPTKDADYNAELWVAFSDVSGSSPIVLNISEFAVDIFSDVEGLVNFGALRLSADNPVDVIASVSGAKA